MFFVSGPVVVSPSETITFQSYLPIRNCSNPKWWKIKNRSIKEIKFDNTKFIYTQKEYHMHRFEITKAEAEDGATYYFSVEGMESNKISVHIDGKYIHIFMWIHIYSGVVLVCGFVGI